jgi:hypothetical protein
MDRTCAQPLKSCQVIADRVALVLSKTVSGVLSIQPLHQSIAGGLGDD